MSFQGDVGGIGLADLLQSLARGREGVLSLHSKDGLQSTLGVEGGQLYLLPAPEEDPEIWRARARLAWVNDPDFRIDALRMEEIARADRLETLYRLLDSEGVHFRFAPGIVPRKLESSALSASESGVERKGPRRDAVYCPPQSIEGLLLEYARIKDESEGVAITWPNFGDAVLQRLDLGPTSGVIQRFHEQCDGMSSVAEIADRLAWAVRVVRNVAFNELQRGAVRFSTPEELLYLAQQELAAGYTERAAGRLRAWLACGPCGPLAPVDAQTFETDWQAGRLPPVLRLLSARQARTFVRRMDHALGMPLLSLEHWRAIAAEKTHDRISQIQLIVWQLRASADPSVPAVRDLTQAARGLLNENRRLAAGAVLRIAAVRAPETSNVRFEIGQLMLQAGIADEAAPFVLDSVRPLMEAGRSEEAVPVLRQLLEAQPNNREVRRLYSRARAHVVRKTLVRKNSLVTMAVVASLSVGAIVQYRSHREFESKLSEVTSLTSDPRAALRVLDDRFAGDTSPRIKELRDELTERKRSDELAVRTAWTDQYRDAAVECTVGDMDLGLRRTLAMPNPPEIQKGDEPLPLASDLYNGLGARLEAQIRLLGPTIVDSPDQARAEQREISTIDELASALVGHDSDATKEFAVHLADLKKRVEERGEQRADERARKLRHDNLALQDQLLAAARAHAKAGDHARALESYKKLLATDDTGKLAPLFAKEIGEVEARTKALAHARELCIAGRHTEARAELKAAFSDPDPYLLPWKVTSVPKGARARLPDGSERVTPFVYESAWNERVPLKFELEGHETVTLTVEHPADQTIVLSRVPELAWFARGRVEAPPVAVGDDHVVCDRSGAIARLANGGQVVWQKQISSLGGIGRAPVFLPKRPGHLLVVTEDGDAWLVDAASGDMEGPWSAGSPPADGPTPTSEGARVQFRNGKSFEWVARLLPDESAAAAAETPAAGSEFGSSSGLSILRRRTSSTTNAASPWSPFEVVISDTQYTLRGKPDGAVRANVRRDGEWTYVAWEAPNVSIPYGRLWISDPKGLRSFLP